MNTERSKRIVIVGGGFAGINLIKKLTNVSGYEVVLADNNNYHFFPPLLYQVATGFMEPSAISYPFRKILRNRPNVHFFLGTLYKVDTQKQALYFDTGKLTYDILVLCTGTTSNYFGMENVQRNAIPMKSISEALSMRNILLKGLEEASKTNDHNERRKLLTTVIAGAGPTGVELAGMFAEMRSTVIVKDYPELKKQDVQDIYLIDGGNAVLSTFTQPLQHYTKEKLEEMGVKVILNTNVTDYKDDKVYLSNGTELESRNLIWAAGVTAKTFEGLDPNWYGRGKRLVTDAYNKVIGSHNIYALGDTSIMTTDEAFPQGHPQVAQVAIQQAANLGDNLKTKGAWKAFKYNDKGSMAIIGSNKAVVEIPKPAMNLKGFIAWFLWVFVHIMSLVNYRNKIRALYNWVGAYISRDQSFRMMIEPEKRKG